MGNLISGQKSKSDKHTKNDFIIEDYFKKFFIHNTDAFDFSAFQSDLFLNLNLRLIDFINDYYKKNTNKKSKKSKIILDTFSFDEFRLIFNLFTNNENFLSNEEDLAYIYYRKNSFYILYDITKGKIGAAEDDGLKLDTVIDIFDYLVQIYINKHNKVPVNYNKKQISEFLISNKISELEIKNFIDNTLYSLDSFIKNYFKLKFLSKTEDVILSTSPISTEFSQILSIPQFFFFTLANSLIYSKRFAFKLYDCQVKGYNMSSLIYSFMGFTGPIAIFIEHFDKEENKVYILGAFLNSNFKECYEKFCGDDLSFVFVILPEMKFYKYKSNPDKICFISSKPQRYSKAEFGIGLGYGYDKFKLWIDGGDMFNKSYLEKYDDVFEEGTPFKDLRQYLNITNIEVYGFGSKDDYESLINKQNRDRNISDKMKKVDKAAFLEGDFNKEMFFENTFSHQSDKR